MSQIDDNNVQVEIQKLLIKINDDMANLNNELSKINSLVEENASLPETIKMVNEKLIATAKEAGIDLENIKDIQGNEDNDQFQEDSDKELTSEANILNKDNIAAATEKLTEKIHHVLNKK